MVVEQSVHISRQPHFKLGLYRNINTLLVLKVRNKNMEESIFMSVYKWFLRLELGNFKILKYRA